EVRVGHHHEVALLVLVAFDDLRPRHLDVLFRAHAPIRDGALVLRVEQAEREVRASGRRIQADRNGDETEGQRAFPDRPHGGLTASARATDCAPARPPSHPAARASRRRSATKRSTAARVEATATPVCTARALIPTTRPSGMRESKKPSASPPPMI